MWCFRRPFWLLLVVVSWGWISCTPLGPRSLGSGRMAYNDVINRTEDEQILNIIVRERYAESAGLLAVSNITASIRFGGSVQSDLAIGPQSHFEGGLVPLNLGLAFEENPTISYTPIRGEEFSYKLLAPLTLEQTMLLSRAAGGDVEPLSFLVRRVNGLNNPLFAQEEREGAFQEFIELYRQLRDSGHLDFVKGEDGDFVLFLQEKGALGNQLFTLLGLEIPEVSELHSWVPLRLGTGSRQANLVDLETPSVLEIIRVMGDGVQVPERHLEEGIVEPSRFEPSRFEASRFEPSRFEASRTNASAWLSVRSSRRRPDDALISVRHRGYWFSISAKDGLSKRVYQVLRALIGMRLDDSQALSNAPILTLPVSR